LDDRACFGPLLGQQRLVKGPVTGLAQQGTLTEPYQSLYYGFFLLAFGFLTLKGFLSFFRVASHGFILPGLFLPNNLCVGVL
jgi:hypothetical protein